MEIIKIDKKSIKIKNFKKESVYEFEEDVTDKSDEEIEKIIKTNKFRILEEHITV